MKKIDNGEVGAVILAAGKGTRMRSTLPKVLHEVDGRSMVESVVQCAVSLVGKHVVVVVGYQRELVRKTIAGNFDVLFACQQELLGTGDAVKSAMPLISETVEDVLILCGDVPRVQPRTLLNLVAFHHERKNHVSILAVRVEDPEGYGRIILDEDENLLAIREEADASASEKQINLINSGIYCINKKYLVNALDHIDQNNAQEEYYLTDVVKIAVNSGKRAGCLAAPVAAEVMGVNTPEDLEQVNAKRVAHWDKLS